jgi:hypothetical protein
MKRILSTALLVASLATFPSSAAADAPQPNALSELYSTEGVYSDSVGNTESYAYHVPQMNADSEAAKAINKEIRERFGSAVEGQLSNMKEGYSLWSWHVEWHSYWHGDQLFLLIKADSNGGFTDYAVYGYDFDSNKRVTNEMILNELGISEEEYLANLREKVQLMFEDMYKDIPENIREQAGMDEMLQKTLAWADMDQPIFIDGVGAVETIVKIASIAGADWYYHLVTPFAYG